jgi:glyoxylase-like metal-dependent hydrolase (beta-lactamase superfamily II)
MDALHSVETPTSRLLNIKTGPFKENCFLLVDKASRRSLLIDPGADPEKISQVVRNEVAQVEHILLTHGHFDHVGAVAQLVRELGVKVHCHESELKLIRRAPFYAIRFIKQKYEAPTGLSPFADAPGLEGSAFTVRTLRTPGHTTGCVCYAVRGFLFTGDTLFHRYVGPTNYPESEPERLRESIDAIMSSELGPETAIMPGHGRPWDLLQARKWWSESRNEAAAFHIGNETGMGGGKERV